MKALVEIKESGICPFCHIIFDGRGTLEDIYPLEGGGIYLCQCYNCNMVFVRSDPGPHADPDNDEFECESCHGVFDIEDSVRKGGRHGVLFCPRCAKEWERENEAGK